MRRSILINVLLLGLGGAAANAQQPLSAIDWLSDVITTPIPLTPIAPPLPPEVAVTRGVSTETIAVTALDAPSADAVGLLPASVSKLPADIWGPSPSSELAQALDRIDAAELLPASRNLLFTLILAELAPPFDSTDASTLFLAREDALVRFGAIEQAYAMLERAGTDTPERFWRWFDLSLLLGTETRACDQMNTAPGLAPSIKARIFCLARTSDWDAAALSLGTAKALGQLSEAEEMLLARFLQQGSGETATPLEVPNAPDPLTFYLFEAIGEPLPTTTLPVAYAHADLRANTGWKAQIEAAERLAARGAIPANKLLGLYTERQPAASGGVWDRVEVIQAFDQALNAGSVAALNLALPLVWDALGGSGLEPIFAELYSDRLQLFELEGTARSLALRTALLSPGYEATAKAWDAQDAEETFLIAVALGNLAKVRAVTDRQAAIAEGLLAAVPPARFSRAIEDGAIGEALLQAIQLTGDGANGDLTKFTDALALFRFLGLETVARRVSLELLILDRRG